MDEVSIIQFIHGNKMVYILHLIATKQKNIKLIKYSSIFLNLTIYAYTFWIIF